MAPVQRLRLALCAAFAACRAFATTTSDITFNYLYANDATANFKFGYSVDVKGTTMIVGSPEDDTYIRDAGSAYIYQFDGSSWVQEAKLEIPSADRSERLYAGRMVAVDGDVALIAASFFDGSKGRVYVYARSGTTWSLQQTLSPSSLNELDHFGDDVDVSGETIVVGAPGSDQHASDGGAVYIFTRSGTTWSEQAVVTPDVVVAHDGFGSAVGIEGDRIVAGAPLTNGGFGLNTGCLYILERSGTTWTVDAQLWADSPVAQETLGEGVDIDGDSVIGGAPNPFSVGAAYVFSKRDGVWREEARLTSSQVSTGDYYGWSVAISNNVALVGSYNDNTADTLAGAVYAFYREVYGDWQFTGKGFQDVGGWYSSAYRDFTGKVVSASGSVCAVSSEGFSGSSSRAGAVLLFEAELLSTYTTTATTTMSRTTDSITRTSTTNTTTTTATTSSTVTSTTTTGTTGTATTTTGTTTTGTTTTGTTTTGTTTTLTTTTGTTTTGTTTTTASTITSSTSSSSTVSTTTGTTTTSTVSTATTTVTATGTTTTETNFTTTWTSTQTFTETNTSTSFIVIRALNMDELVGQIIDTEQYAIQALQASGNSSLVTQGIQGEGWAFAAEVNDSDVSWAVPNGVAQVVVPARALAQFGATYVVIVQVLEVALSLIDDKRGEVNGDLLSITMFDHTGYPIEAVNLIDPIRFHLDAFTTEKSTCKFFDEIANEWKDDDLVTVEVNEEYLECATYHLTLFADIQIIPPIVVDNSLSWDMFLDFMWLVRPATLFFLLVLIVHAVAWRYREPNFEGHWMWIERVIPTTPTRAWSEDGSKLSRLDSFTDGWEDIQIRACACQAMAVACRVGAADCARFLNKEDPDDGDVLQLGLCSTRNPPRLQDFWNARYSGRVWVLYLALQPFCKIRRVTAMSDFWVCAEFLGESLVSMAAITALVAALLWTSNIEYNSEDALSPAVLCGCLILGVAAWTLAVAIVRIAQTPGAQAGESILMKVCVVIVFVGCSLFPLFLMAFMSVIVGLYWMAGAASALFCRNVFLPFVTAMYLAYFGGKAARKAPELLPPMFKDLFAVRGADATNQPAISVWKDNCTVMIAEPIFGDGGAMDLGTLFKAWVEFTRKSTARDEDNPTELYPTTVKASLVQKRSGSPPDHPHFAAPDFAPVLPDANQASAHRRASQMLPNFAHDTPPPQKRPSVVSTNHTTRKASLNVPHLTTVSPNKLGLNTPEHSEGKHISLTLPANSYSRPGSEAEPEREPIDSLHNQSMHNHSQDGHHGRNLPILPHRVDSKDPSKHGHHHGHHPDHGKPGQHHGHHPDHGKPGQHHGHHADHGKPGQHHGHHADHGKPGQHHGHHADHGKPGHHADHGKPGHHQNHSDVKLGGKGNLDDKVGRTSTEASLDTELLAELGVSDRNTPKAQEKPGEEDVDEDDMDAAIAGLLLVSHAETHDSSVFSLPDDEAENSKEISGSVPSQMVTPRHPKHPKK